MHFATDMPMNGVWQGSPPLTYMRFFFVSFTLGLGPKRMTINQLCQVHQDHNRAANGLFRFVTTNPQ